MNNKTIGFILVCAGVAIAAAYGARNASDVVAREAVQGRAALTAGSAAKALKMYCYASADAAVEPPPGVLAGMAPLVRAEACAKTLTAKAPGAPTAEHSDLHKAWIDTEAGAAVAAAAVKGLGKPIQPKERLSAWFGESGLAMGAGVLLIIFGSLMSRKAAKAAATAEPEQTADGKGPVDFGDLVRRAEQEIAALSKWATELGPGADTARFTESQERIQSIQLETIEPIVEARFKVQARFGMAGFATLFGPLSGAERSLNRAWCASVDSHWPETLNSFERAALEINNTRAELDSLLASQPA